MYLISACLVGVNCRYDGTSFIDQELEALVKSGQAMIVCPEVLGRLDIPRVSCEIVESKDGTRKVLNNEGDDFTDSFLEGAQKTLDICKVAEIEVVVLKSKSPSCGYGKIYNGSFEGKLIKGNGLTADLLAKNGIRVLNEENWQRVIK